MFFLLPRVLVILVALYCALAVFRRWRGVPRGRGGRRSRGVPRGRSGGPFRRRP